MFSREFCELFKNTYFVEYLGKAGFETLVLRSLFNQVASLTIWKHLTVLETEVATGVLLEKLFLEISQNPQENTCVRVFFLIKLQAWGLGLGEGIHKLVQFYVVMEIRWKLHCQVVATHAPT